MTLGEAAKATISHDPLLVQPDMGALQLDYKVEKGNLSGLYMPVSLSSWAKAKSVKFRVRTDESTIIAVSLQKQDGGRFTAMVSTTKDSWQNVELSTADFVLGQDKDDPKDSDGKLDMAKVNNIAIVDVSQFFLGIDNPIFADLFSVKKGSRTLLIDQFSVGTSAIPAGIMSSGDKVQLETFAHPQISWMGLGGMKLSYVSDKPLVGKSLRADYQQKPGKPAILNRALQPWVFSGTKTLSIDVASAQPVKLIVQLEQTDGGKYNMMLDVPGGSVAQHKELLLSGFNRADDSTDSDTKLHLSLVKSLTIIDISGIQQQADHANTLWVNHLVAQG